MLSIFTRSLAKTKEERFWAWFRRNERMLYNFEADEKVIFDHLLAEMLKVYPYAAFEMGPIDEDGRQEFVVSAGGHASDFPAVEALCAAAPRLRRWRIVKFAPRRPYELFEKTEVGKVALRASQLTYSLSPAGQQVDLTVFVEGAVAADEDDFDFKYCVWMTLWKILGEKDIGVRLRNWSVLDDSSGCRRAGREIANLASDFDAYFAKQLKRYH